MRQPTITRRTLLGGAGLALARPALAAGYPDRPIRLIIPFPPGGTVDVTARPITAAVSEMLGQPIVIDNQPGAGGNVGTQRVARSPADGYTLLFTAPNHTINPGLMPNAGFDPQKDFAPISLCAQIPEILVCHKDAPFRTFQEFVTYARAHPRELTYSSAGIGSHPHVTMELLLHRLGLEVLHVPYRGAAPAFTDLVAGRVQLKLDSYATSASQIEAGAIRVLAIASPQRSPAKPDVPTIAELGLPGFEGILWMGYLAPSGTPTDTVERFAKAAQEAVKSSAVERALVQQGVEPVGSTPGAFAARIAQEIPQWREVIRDANIRPE
ncbi:Bug family tripartite tricarboxylate transporter substrate binding protein [Pararoseomonas indoligenes]|uniref:Tripartite tricarboxylate transporter substrate binding protein n=1 Tax=Roseomonas indoligenes TaxID=2820811 RepID=A0A940N9G3_9PROT|nr:tripartite tricarboxylate transporter substrate binding protein [Pararoseomonas indoligenes]MBP0496477.1 tripartite tricarboxylate transporter substrate binding protein [Pararoseomonas indoligenes]